MKPASQPTLDQDELPPELTQGWSKKKSIFFFIACLLIAILGVFGFLFYKEYKKTEVAGLNLPARLTSPPVKIYTNDYWGIKFSYPGDWWPVIGSFEEGNYYFSSENINFLQEQSNNEAIIKLETYHNIQFPDFKQWLADREENYFPRDKILDEHEITINGHAGKEYVYNPNKPQWDNALYIDKVVLPRDNRNIYIFFLITKNQAVHDNFKPLYDKILNSAEFYNGFGS